MENHRGIPLGIYVFKEYFCIDLSCNCERVLIKVLYLKSESDRDPREVATFSYAWSRGQDQAWRATDDALGNPFLDPFHYQASFADELMDYWSGMVANDMAYAQRLQTHYGELRAKKGTSGGSATAFGPSAADVPLNRFLRNTASCNPQKKTPDPFAALPPGSVSAEAALGIAPLTGGRGSVAAV